jgi:hypothetical protein
MRYAPPAARTFFTIARALYGTAMHWVCCRVAGRPLGGPVFNAEDVSTHDAWVPGSCERQYDRASC